MQHPCQSLISGSLGTFYPASISNTPFSIPVNLSIQHPRQFSNPGFLAFPAFHNQQSQHAHLSYRRSLSNAGALHNWLPDKDIAVAEKIQHSCKTLNWAILSNTDSSNPVNHPIKYLCRTPNPAILPNTYPSFPVTHSRKHFCLVFHQASCPNTPSSILVKLSNQHSCKTINPRAL